MPLDARYRELSRFLHGHKEIWLASVLQNWPSSRASFPEPWLAWIAGLSNEDQRLVWDEEPLLDMPRDLRTLMTELERLSWLDRRVDERPLDALDTQGLNRKKLHEIQRILAMLSDEAYAIESAVDVGGGMGHLARLCVKCFDWTFHSIDRDAALQAKGRWWLERSRGLDRSKLSFVNASFPEDAAPQVDALFARPHSLSLGLHTCGGLALSQFRRSAASDLIINFGCCYDKMDLKRDLNLSATAQSLGLPWSQHALFLATRSRKGMERDAFALMKRVNDYRFSFDLLCRSMLPELGFVVAGDAPKALYEGDFAAYARDRLDALKIGAHLSDGDLATFASQPRIQAEVQEIFAAHVVRNLFARPLEIAILLDRALWLEEEGLDVKILQVFERELSPRNVAIVARRVK